MEEKQIEIDMSDTAESTSKGEPTRPRATPCSSQSHISVTDKGLLTINDSIQEQTEDSTRDIRSRRESSELPGRHRKTPQDRAGCP